MGSQHPDPDCGANKPNCDIKLPEAIYVEKIMRSLLIKISLAVGVGIHVVPIFGVLERSKLEGMYGVTLKDPNDAP